MAYQLNDRIKNLTPYKPIEGDFKIRLDANESFLTLPEDLQTKVQNAVSAAKLNRYPDPYATRVIKAFSELYGVDKNMVTAGNGSDELIQLIIGTFFDDKDELVTLSDDFSMYRIYAETYGVPVSVFPKNKNLEVNIDALIDYINKSGAKGVIFSNPCNPTSLVIDERHIKRLVRSINALVIVDEAYMDFADEPVLDNVKDYDNLIVLKTCSKALGLAAIRLGFAVASRQITKALRAVKSPYNVNAITQAIGEAVLTDGEYCLDCIRKIIRSRDMLYNDITKLYIKYDEIEKVYETTTNFVFVKTPKAKYIFDELLKRSIAVRYMGDYLRISAGSKKENAEFIEAFEDILKGIED